MTDLIDLTLTHAADPAHGSALRRDIEGHIVAVRASAGKGNRNLVARAEADVSRNPSAAFAYDSDGFATLGVAEGSWLAGRFETVSIGALRERARHKRAGATTPQVRLWVLDGASPVTDIGTLQAGSSAGALFQVASQFNCLESPGPYVTSVASYFSDPTQGPRASISAFPATLLRHYRAPGPDGERFVQTSDGRQIDLLRDVCGPGFSRNGYFTGDGPGDRQAVFTAFETHFEAIHVGVHDGVQVALGYNWDGAVEESDQRRIAQVFTSTVAGGAYGGARHLGGTGFVVACRQLLRAAYLGTLLAAATLDRTRVVLTLIGGGVFHNPIALIWEAILWAIDEVTPLLSGNLDVIVNGYRDLGGLMDLDQTVLPAVRARGGAILSFNHTGLVAIRQ